MKIGMIFFVIAAIVFFIGGIGSTIVGPNPVIWGLFCIAIGLVLGEYDLGFNRRR